MIENNNQQALVLPVIDIEPKQLTEKSSRLLDNFSTVDWVFFISANAVHQSISHIKPYQHLLNKSIKVAVIGPATKNALMKYGIKADVMPNIEYNSERLLEHQILLMVSGLNIIIFRGTGGRTLLADTLKMRGAIVHSIETYHRCIAKKNSQLLHYYLRDKLLQAIIVMSNESLQNLQIMAGKKYWQMLKSQQLVVISERTAKLAHIMGFDKSAIISLNSNDIEVYNCLQSIT